MGPTKKDFSLFIKLTKLENYYKAIFNVHLNIKCLFNICVPYFFTLGFLIPFLFLLESGTFQFCTIHWVKA